MKKLIPIIEGDGEMKAIPNLLSRILTMKQAYDWGVGRPIQGKSLGHLRKNLSRFLALAELEGAAATIIILDLDDGCPRHEAASLVQEIKAIGGRVNPVAVVFAHREYEAWLLASLATIAGQYHIPLDAAFSGEVESLRDVKGWFTRQMCHDGVARRYKETIHQVELTRLMDLDRVAVQSRSFRRLLKAVDEVVTAEQESLLGYVTPIMP